jgi:hypothetical protein
VKIAAPPRAKLQRLNPGFSASREKPGNVLLLFAVDAGQMTGVKERASKAVQQTNKVGELWA